MSIDTTITSETASIPTPVAVPEMIATIHRLFEEAAQQGNTQKLTAAAGRMNRILVATALETMDITEFYARIRREFIINAQAVIYSGTLIPSEEFKDALDSIWKHPVYTPESQDVLFL